MVIRRIVPLSAAKVMALVYAVLGLCIGAIISIVGLAGGFAGTGTTNPMFGVGAIIIFPLIYGAIGFIAMAIICAIYNWAAGVVGGVEIQTESETVG